MSRVFVLADTGDYAVAIGPVLKGETVVKIREQAEERGCWARPRRCPTASSGRPAMTPDPHYPAPADLAPAAPWEPKRLLTPEQLAALMVPQQPRRRVVLPAVVRLGRRAGRLR